MRAADVQPKKYVKYDVEYNDKDPKFKVGDRMKISKYKNVFGKDYTPSLCDQECKKTLHRVPYVIIDLTGDKIVGVIF